MAEYLARTQRNKSPGNQAFMKIVEDHSYNPLRDSSRLANSELSFPIVVICGAEGVGGTSDCMDFMKVNRHYDDRLALTQALQISNTDESL